MLKGPQGGGSGRNASAGAIRIVSRKPGDELEATLRSSIGNYNLRDFEGAIQAPLRRRPALLAAGVSLHRARSDPHEPLQPDSEAAASPDGWCPIPGLPFIPNISTAREMAGQHVPSFESRRENAVTAPAPGSRSPWNQVSFCGEELYRQNPIPPPAIFPFGRLISALPGDLDDKVNDIGNWSARGTLRYQPPGTDMDWLLSGHGSRLDAGVHARSGVRHVSEPARRSHRAAVSRSRRGGARKSAARQGPDRERARRRARTAPGRGRRRRCLGGRLQPHRQHHAGHLGRLRDAATGTSRTSHSPASPATTSTIASATRIRTSPRTCSSSR